MNTLSGSSAESFGGTPMLSAVIVPIVIALLIKIFLGIIVGNIAKKKGYGFWGFFILGFVFFFIGLIVSLCLSNKNEQAKTIADALSYSPNSECDELIKLKKLFDSGVITEEEFEQKKKQLLGL